MLAGSGEGLRECLGGECRRNGRRGWRTYAADDLVVVGQVGFAVFAAVDAFAVQVDVVGEAHPCG
jgi:hypothetical protein